MGTSPDFPQENRETSPFLFLLELEHVLQSKLQYAGTLRSSDQPEGPLIDRRGGIVRDEAVRDVVGLGSNLEPLCFLKPKYSRESRVEGPESRASNTVTPNIS